MADTYNFCTSFGDDKFLLRGLALYYSLEKHIGIFRLWVLCMDQSSFELLRKLDLPKIKLVRVSDFEDDALRIARTNRNFREFCLTTKSYVLEYILKSNPDIETLAWLDADLYFFDSIQRAYQELGDHSALISRHNYPKDIRERTEKVCGKFNAGFIVFKNDFNSLACLNWWKARCLEWCKGVYEDGKYGEQLYMDAWPNKFAGVKVLENQGYNMAYWNMGRYKFSRSRPLKEIVDSETGTSYDLSMYHFSGVTLYKLFDRVRYMHNRRFLPIGVLRKIYDEYMVGINWAHGLVQKKIGMQTKFGLKTAGASFFTEYFMKEFLSYAHEYLDVPVIKKALHI